MLDGALRAADWAGFPERKRQSLERGKRRGLGLAVYLEWTGALPTETVDIEIDAQGTVVAVILASAVLYIVPAIYLRKRRAWSRYLLIGVAAIGIAGGLMALPNSILSIAIHSTLLFLMLQQPTKLWFHHR